MCAQSEAVGDKPKSGLSQYGVSALQPLETREAWKPAPVLGGRLNTEGRSGEAHWTLKGNGSKKQAEELNGGEQELSLTGPYLGEKPCASLALLFGLFGVRYC